MKELKPRFFCHVYALCGNNPMTSRGRKDGSNKFSCLILLKHPNNIDPAVVKVKNVSSLKYWLAGGQQNVVFNRRI